MSGSGLRVGSLFAGIGGFDLGFERAGMRTVWFCEQDEFCQRVLAERWPGVPCYPDVCELRGADVEPVDVLCGGFPCQDISVAGKAAGLEGARSGLWSEYARLIGELRPRWVVVENVSALLARGMGTVLGDLAALGYDAEWDCIPASAIGAPHQRDRIWLVAYPQCGGDRREVERGEAGGPLAERSAGGARRSGDGSGARTGVADPGRECCESGRDAGDVVRAAGAAEGEGLQRERCRCAAVDRGAGGAELADVADAARHAEAGAGPESGSERERAWARGERGGAGALADAELQGLEGLGSESGQPEVGESRDGCALADADSEGSPHVCEGETGCAVGDNDWRRYTARDGGFARGRPGEWWAVEPDVGRVAHGVPARVDRLRSLGNALVPQIAEWIGHRIVAYEADR